MNQLSADTLIQLVLWLGVLMGLLVLAVIVVQTLRGRTTKDQPSESQMLTKFQEMRLEGDIDEAEYRTIKAVLGDKLHRSAKGGKDKA
jgi:uncharacterized membrane protein